jgi:hypothetical protein
LCVLFDRAFALVVEVWVVRWAEERRAFRAGAASSAAAGKSKAKARRAVMGALKRILIKMGGAERQSNSYLTEGPSPV